MSGRDLSLVMREVWPKLPHNTRERITDLIPGCPKSRGHYASVENTRLVTDPDTLTIIRSAVYKAIDTGNFLSLVGKRAVIVQMYTTQGLSRLCTDEQKHLLLGFLVEWTGANLLLTIKTSDQTLDYTIVDLIKKSCDLNTLQLFEDLLLMTVQLNKRR